MSAIRQDAWTDEEDLMLAETVLRHIREGSTQLSAFEEVGKSLSRTPAACGFRWNSLIRKRYENAINLAKKQRKELTKKQKSEAKKKERPSVQLVEQSEPKQTGSLTLEAVIHYLQQLDTENQGAFDQEKEIQQLEEQMAVLQSERIELIQANQKLKEEFNAMKQDYQSLIQIMERAKRFTSTDRQDSDWSNVTEALSMTNEKE